MTPFEEHEADLGYGLLLKAYTPNVADATEEQIEMMVKASIPQVTSLFWAFRIMVVAGFSMLLIFSYRSLFSLLPSVYIDLTTGIHRRHWGGPVLG